MKKLIKLLANLTLCLILPLTLIVQSGCAKNDENVIYVCSSSVPHAEVLNGIVKKELAAKGYELRVSVLDWTLQNDAVANKDYDANYFQHVPYLETYAGKTELFATCKVHYEPLGIYYGKTTVGTDLKSGTTFEICDDESNAIRAFALLENKGVISREAEKENFPITESDDKLNFSERSKIWTSKDGRIKVTLVAEELLVSLINDYDFALLPCNTALTGKITSERMVAKEDDPAQVAEKANVIAARKADYKNDEKYKAKIDALTDVMLSKAVSDYFKEKYNGVIICDDSTQIDLRNSI